MERNSMIKRESSACAISSRSETSHLLRLRRLFSEDLDQPTRSASSESVISSATTHCIRISSDMLLEENSSPSLYSNAVYRVQFSALATSCSSGMRQWPEFTFVMKFGFLYPQRRASSLSETFPDLMHWILIFCLIFMWLLLERYWWWCLRVSK